MKGLLLCVLFVFSNGLLAELLPVKDEVLSDHFAQLDRSGADLEASLALSDVAVELAPLRLDARSVESTPQPSAGITLDIDLQLYIDQISWVDIDGAGAAGTRGAVTLKGLSVGHLDDINQPKAAVIRGVTIDVDGRDGVVIGIEQIGDRFGNGIDINIDSIQIK